MVKKLLCLVPLIGLLAFTSRTYSPGLHQPVSFYPTYIKEQLHLKTGKSFFQCSKSDKPGNLLPDTVLPAMFYYAYVSDKQDVKAVSKQAFKSFWTDSLAAFHYADSLKPTYEVMVYRTAGTSAAKFSYRMFMYKPVSVIFIMLHEAIHRHKSAVKSKLPYIYEEALCDVMAHRCLKELSTGTADSSEARIYTQNMEQIYGFINQTAAGLLSKQQGKDAIYRVTSQSDLFLKDRYEYEVNNAYLLRNASYCKHYFLLKEVLNKTGNTGKFLKKVLSLKGSEAEVEQELKAMLP